MSNVFRSLTILVLMAVFVTSCESIPEDGVLTKQGTFAGTTINYKIVFPPNFDRSRFYPAVLAFAGGRQDLPTIEDTLQKNWLPEARRRGYLVILPAAPDGELFYREGARIFPEFLDRMLSDYRIEGGKFHVAGRSNGGVSAFHVATRFPGYFRSVTGFPGFVWDARDTDFEALKQLPVYLFVGLNDPEWLATMQWQSARMREKGVQVSFEVEGGQEHAIGSLMGEGSRRLFDHFDDAAKAAR